MSPKARFAISARILWKRARSPLNLDAVASSSGETGQRFWTHAAILRGISPYCNIKISSGVPLFKRIDWPHTEVPGGTSLLCICNTMSLETGAGQWFHYTLHPGPREHVRPSCAEPDGIARSLRTGDRRSSLGKSRQVDASFSTQVNHHIGASLLHLATWDAFSLSFQNHPYFVTLDEVQHI